MSPLRFDAAATEAALERGAAFLAAVGG
jgi:hypothetical protein